MATYKVLQDVEAEDKLVGPLTLRQFIYACIAALSGYLGFLVTAKGAAFLLVVFLPVTATCGFFAFPWKQDQPTEVWALAKIRFYLKPRRRIWDQSGAKELVNITAPKAVEQQRTNGLSQSEVHSRLTALASTIDSRGWAIKNTNLNLAAAETTSLLPDASDRLVQASSLPQAVSDVDIRASDDILDESANPVAQHFDSMITAATTAHRQQILAQMQQQADTTANLPAVPGIPQAAPTPPQKPANYWFLQGATPTVNQPQQTVFSDDATVISPGIGPQDSWSTPAAMPTPEEKALAEKLRIENAQASMTAAYGHMKTLKTPEQLAAEARAATATAAAKVPVTPSNQAAIINLANNDDLDVATIARQAHQQAAHSDDEVVISLH